MREHDALDAFTAENVHHGRGEVQGNIEILQTLHDVALEPAGIRHDLRHGVDVCALERHAPRHNQADVAGAEDHNLAPGHQPFHVDEPLRRARRVDARRAVAGDVQRPARPLAAAHREDDRLRADLLQPALAPRHGQHTLRRDIEHHRVQPVWDLQRLHLLDEAVGIFRAGQLLPERVQAEARVNALVQDAAELTVALEDQDILHARAPRGDGRGQPRRAAADDGQLYLFHACTSFVFPTSRRLSPPAFVSSVCGTLSSRERISITRGPQKPP